MLVGFMRHAMAENDNTFCARERDSRLLPLTLEGADQAKKVANLPALSADCFGKIDEVYTSTMTRAIQTAYYVLSNRKELPNITQDSRLDEIDDGYRNNPNKWFDISKAVERRQLAGDYTLHFGETGDGESRLEVVERSFSFLIDVMHRRMLRAYDSSILVISHWRLLEYMLTEVDIALGKPVGVYDFDNAAVLVRSFNPSDVARLSDHLSSLQQQYGE